MKILLLQSDDGQRWNIQVDGAQTYCGLLEKHGDRFQLRRYYDTDVMLTPSQVAPKLKETWTRAVEFEVVMPDGNRRPMKGT
jgi:hypothetical protein